MTEHLDVLIVGAGLTGVGAACRLRSELPGKAFAVLEARQDLGGTWDLFRYPGIRSDSDMQTFAYRFRPWRGARTIADGPSILAYIRETAAEYGVDRHIRFGHKVIDVHWSSVDARWSVTAEHDGETVHLTCGFLYMCTGYYSYEHGHTPHFDGLGDFTGRVVHPQQWPADLDHTGRRVVVIGSGATAVTLVPTLAASAAHVTMLQRSPTHIFSLPSADPLGLALRGLLGERLSYPVVRWKNILAASASYQLGQRLPGPSSRFIRKRVQRSLPDGYDVATHFTPRYKPWDQRLCIVPDGDLFKAIGSGRASVVTDHVEAFIPSGLRLKSGRTLDADLVVTATGLDLLAFGGVRIVVDGTEVALRDTTAYRGMMLSGVPNLAFTIGYTNASWTLKADLVGEFVCRLLAHMDRHHHLQVTPTAGEDITRRPLLDFAAGYVRRSIDTFPRGGDKAPWKAGTSYLLDAPAFRHARLDDDALRYSRPTTKERGG